MEMLPEMERKMKNVITRVKTTQLQNQCQMIPMERTHTLKSLMSSCILTLNIFTSSYLIASSFIFFQSLFKSSGLPEGGINVFAAVLHTHLAGKFGTITVPQLLPLRQLEIQRLIFARSNAELSKQRHNTLEIGLFQNNKTV